MREFETKMIEVNGHKIDPQYYIDKWTNWALEATPATDERVIQNVKNLYKKAKLKEPEVKVFRNYEQFMQIDWASVGDSVRASVGDSVWASVWASVGASVRDSVRDSVGDSVRDSVRDSVWASVGAWYWAEDLAFGDVFVDTNVLSKEKAQELEEYKKLLETQRIAIRTQDIVYVLVAPTIRREDGRLHSDQRPALEWENGTGQYYIDGVNLPKELWESILSQKMTFAEIMKIDISDQRTVALKYNPQAILNEGSTLVHKDHRNNELYLIEGKQINKDLEAPKIWFLKMLCPTGRTFIEGVPPDEAEKNPNATYLQALLCGLTLQEYLDMELES